MNVKEEIKNYLQSQPEPKRSEMQELHKRILKLAPKSKLWFLDGKNEQGKTVTNPNIGYGSYTINYADGSSREFYQAGFTANKTGISVYILGLADKTYLAKTYGKKIGKAKVTGYCINFRSLNDIDINTLEDALKFGLKPRT